MEFPNHSYRPNGNIEDVALERLSDEDSLCSLKLHRHENPGMDAGSKKAFKKLIIACVLCTFFIIAEIVGGSLAHSLAIMTDAAHLVTDLIGFLISLCAILLARKGPTKRLTFGWYRAETLGALFSVQLIWVVTGVLVYLAVRRVITQDFKLEPIPMLVTASCGVAVNLLMAAVLHQHVPSSGHGHSHGGGHFHAHGHSHEANINVRAAFIHCIGDLIQSIGVLAAALVVYYKPEYKLADPICTFISSLLVTASTIFIFKDAVLILMEATPRSVNRRDLYNKFMAVDGVQDVHNIRIWSLTPDKAVCSIHLTVDSTEMTSNATLQRCQEIVGGVYNFHDVTIQVEDSLKVPNSYSLPVQQSNLN